MKAKLKSTNPARRASVVRTALVMEGLHGRIDALERRIAAVDEDLQQNLRNILTRLAHLNQTSTVDHIRSLTIRMGQMETNLTTIRDGINAALKDFHK